MVVLFIVIFDVVKRVVIDFFKVIRVFLINVKFQVINTLVNILEKGVFYGFSWVI